jgi:hypothetical protein
LEGYGVCLQNGSDNTPVTVVFDAVLLSEDVSGGWKKKKGKGKKGGDFEKDKHLTPLEMSLDRSLSAAHTVMREMKYMELREARMRQTADSINTRVRWFSYLSVGVLLTVTYVQVTYLKRYFHKKKLM